ncbi:MAG: hypothetical protein HY606_07665, partial [Planctomycetes bacterium]|nr:hypothetical protein [Planctomycetota bacterium]
MTFWFDDLVLANQTTKAIYVATQSQKVIETAENISKQIGYEILTLKQGDLD